MPAELVLAVVGLAGQLLDGFVKLNDFCQRVNEAPEDLLGLEADHANLTMAVDNCAEQRKKDKLEHDDSFTKSALQVCEDELRTLADLTASLKPEPGARWWKRKQKAIKTVFKDRTIENCKGRLEAARSLLTMARNETAVQHLSDIDVGVEQMRHAIEDVKQRMSTVDSTMLLMSSHMINSLEPLLKQISAPADAKAVALRSTSAMPEKVGDYVCSRHTDPNTNKVTIRRRTPTKTGVERYAESYLAFAVNVHYRHERFQVEIPDCDDDDDDDDRGENGNTPTSPRRVVRREQETSFTIVPNWWPCKIGFHLSYRRTGQGWLDQWKLRPFNLRPHNALVFELCSKGDMEGVRSLFRRGEASPFDVDPEGWTPLHCAAQTRQYRLCKMLLNEGADARSLDLSNVSPLHLALTPICADVGSRGRKRWDAKDDAVLLPRLLRLLVDMGGSDPAVEGDDGNNCFDLVSRYAAVLPSDALLSLFRPVEFEFDPNHRDCDGLMPFMKVKFLLAATMADLETLFQRVDDINATFEPAEDSSLFVYECGWTVLHICLGYMLGEHEYDDPDCVRQKKDRIKFLLQRGADPHAISSRGESPTDIALRFSSRFCFDLWIQLLSEMGYDLTEFARQEIAAHADVLWYAMNWCDYSLIALLELDDELEDDLMDVNPFGSFLARESVPAPGDVPFLRRYTRKEYEEIFLLGRDAFHSRRHTLKEDEEIDLFGPDAETLAPTAMDMRLRQRVDLKMARLCPRSDMWAVVTNRSGRTVWNSSHDLSDWIMYGMVV